MRFKQYAVCGVILGLFVWGHIRGFAQSQANSSITAPKSFQIPIKHVWAHNIPGTRGFLVNEIVRTMPRLDKQDVPPTGFVVCGTGLDALIECHSIIVDKNRPMSEFTAGQELSICFIPRQFAWELHIRGVERHANTITLSYRFSPASSAGNRSENFAIVPVGKLAPGRYRVQYQQCELDEKYRRLGFKNVIRSHAERVVGRPWEFTVVNDPETISTKIESDRTLQSISLDKIWAHNMPDTLPVSSLVTLDRSVEAGKAHTHNITVPLSEVTSALSGDGPNTKQGFVVQGTEFKAICDAHAIIVGSMKKPKTFFSNMPLTCVFFTRPMVAGLELVSAERTDKEIEIRYRLIRQGAELTTSYIAFIPLGKLSPGEYTVKFLMSHTGFIYSESTPELLASSFICKPFRFSVTHSID